MKVGIQKMKTIIRELENNEDIIIAILALVMVIVIKYLLKNNSKIILLPHSFHQIDEVANDYLYLKQFTFENTKYSIP